MTAAQANALRQDLTLSHFAIGRSFIPIAMHYHRVKCLQALRDSRVIVGLVVHVGRDAPHARNQKAPTLKVAIEVARGGQLSTLYLRHYAGRVAVGCGVQRRTQHAKPSKQAQYQTKQPNPTGLQGLRACTREQGTKQAQQCQHLQGQDQ